MQKPTSLQSHINDSLLEFSQLVASFEITNQSREDLLSLIDDIELARSLAQPLYFFGMGKSFNLCQLISGMFRSIGVRAEAYDCSNFIHGDLGTLGNTHNVCVYLSKSGTTKETTDLMRLLSDSKANRQYLITMGSPVFFGDSKVIKIISNQMPKPFLPLDSNLLFLLFLQSLVLGLAKEMDINYLDYKTLHPGGTFDPSFI